MPLANNQPSERSYDNQRNQNHIVMDGAGALHVAQQRRESSNGWGPQPKRDEFDPNIFKNHQDMYNIQK